MFRMYAALAAFALVFALAASASAAPVPAGDETVAVAEDGPAQWMTDDDAKDEGKKEEAMEEKKKRRYPEYSRRLKQKLKKPGPPPPKPKYKPWNKVITDEHEKIEGLIPIYKKQEEVYFVLGEDLLDKPMLAVLSLSQGIGSHFVYGGLPVDDVMFDFHREEDHLQIRRLSTRFRAPGDEALEKTIDLTFSESIIASLPIESEKDDQIAVEMSKYFLSDVSGMSIWLGFVFRQPVRLNKANWFASIKNYPENTEIDTRLTYSPSRVVALELPNVPDPRYIQVGVHYSIIKLPEEPMMPRIADDRVGYFMESYKDFTRQRQESFFVHYANRWRLEKKDPGAALSEPKKPIVFYLDHTIPEEYVQYIKEGIELWQRAFEVAGFKNAIIAKRAPTPEEDPEYDPEDARYNTIRWNVSDTPMYGAIGPSRVDPRTGEIIDADILFEHNMVANFGRLIRRIGGPRTALMSIDPNLKPFWMAEEELANDIKLEEIPQLRGKAHMFCAINDCMAIGGSFLAVHQMANGYIDPEGKLPKEYVADALRFVAAHEVGHTLGLRHNFMSSGSTPYSKLNDKKTVEEFGMTGSIMDYPSPNVAFNGAEQGYYWSPTVGTYDDWAIRWGYSDVDGDDMWAQSKNLEPIAAQCEAKEHLYGTDFDTYPMGAMDPRSNTNDLSDDPVAWAKERMAICDDLLRNGKLEENVVQEGSNYLPMRYAVQTLLVQRYIASGIAIKNIGGAYTSRSHRGGTQLPFDPIPAEDQLDALNWVIENGLMSSNYTLPPEMLNKLGDDKMGTWQNNLWQRGRRFEFPLSGWVGAIQNALLTRMLMPQRQVRVVEATYVVDRPFKLSQLYGGLTRAIWTNNPAPSGRTAAWDRNLQRIYTQKLITQVTTPYPDTPQDAIALSRLNLRRIRQTANTTLQRQGLDDETNAHLMETIARIDRALDAQRMTGF